MKTPWMIAALLPLAFTSCQKPSASSTPPLKETVAETTPPPATPIPQQPVAVNTPAPHLAPKGVFYLISRVRIETSDGIINLPPGTGVKLVRPGVYLTPSGETHLDASQITNDLDIARQARDASIAGQAAVDQRLASQRDSASTVKEASNRSAEALHNDQLKEIDRQRLTTALDTLKRKKIDLEAQKSGLSHTQHKENYDKVYKGRIIAGDTGEQLRATREQIKVVELQIQETETALANLK